MSRHSGDTVIRLDLHVRPHSRITRVGGVHDGALVVRVLEPAHDGKATSAALRAVANALGIAPQSVMLRHGATARRKAIGIHVPASDSTTIAKKLCRLRAEHQQADRGDDGQ